MNMWNTKRIGWGRTPAPSGAGSLRYLPLLYLSVCIVVYVLKPMQVIIEMSFHLMKCLRHVLLFLKTRFIAACGRSSIDLIPAIHGALSSYNLPRTDLKTYPINDFTDHAK